MPRDSGLMSTLLERAAIIPGASCTRSKAVFGQWTEGHGCGGMLDGRIDMLSALGARTLGNNGDGVYSLPHVLEIQAAEAVLRHVAPWASWVKFTKTGSESTHCALRAAKAYTQRPHVIAMSDAYHGWFETWDHVTRVPYGSDPRTWVDGWFWRYVDEEAIAPEKIAAVFIEPARWQHTDVEWLVDVRLWCDAYGIQLVFDSMIYGGRFSVGGASRYFGLNPHMETFGKAYGGGKSVAFTVGREETKQHATIASGTYSGEPAGLRSLIDALDVYANAPVISTLQDRGEQLFNGLRAVIPSGLGVVEGKPQCLRVRFFNKAHGKQFADAMWARGVIWHPDVVLVNYGHSVADIFHVIRAAREAVQTLG